jgi:hypothetical protein
MRKHKLGLASLVLVLGVAAVSAAYGAAMTMPNFSRLDSGVIEVKGKFCPIIIDCIKGKVGKCHYSTHKHRCVCKCVPRHSY